MLLRLSVVLAIWFGQQGDWPVGSGLSRPPGAAVAVLFVDPDDGAAGEAVETLAEWLAERPAAEAHLVIPAGSGPCSAAFLRLTQRLPRTLIHFPRDGAEVVRFGVTRAVEGMSFDPWGRRQALPVAARATAVRGVVWSRV